MYMVDTCNKDVNKYLIHACANLLSQLKEVKHKGGKAYLLQSLSNLT